MGDIKSWRGFAIACSDVCGWVYFLLWSLSFYPQPLLNYQRRSTSGVTVDFPLLNVLGFACYTIYTSALLFNCSIRKEYATRHPTSPEPTVRLNDFAFALHALIICIVTYTQFWSSLWGFERLEGKRASRVVQGIFCGSIASLAVVGLIAAGSSKNSAGLKTWSTIDVIYAASWVKLVVTCGKYVPQAWHNYKAQSTAGWSIVQVLMDFFGGILNIAQLLIDASMQGDWSGVTGNPVKFFLGNVSLFFDIIFMIQHFVLYRKRVDGRKHIENMEGDHGEMQPLLE